jgi:hypothetical protein
MQDQDPDEQVAIPSREIRAALALAEGLLTALEAREGLGDELASARPPPYRSSTLLPGYLRWGPCKMGIHSVPT